VYLLSSKDVPGNLTFIIQQPKPSSHIPLCFFPPDS
jgi:hypothetical protein